MIKDYVRPGSLTEAIDLLTDRDHPRKPLGGGTTLSRQQNADWGVVDLQKLSLDTIERRGQRLGVGAMVRLSDLVVHSDVYDEIKRAVQIDASANIRNAATLGGWIVSSDARSIFSTVLLALDTTLSWAPDQVRERMGNWLPVRGRENPGVLLTEAEWWMRPKLAFEYVARSPKDRPIVVVAVANWDSGRTRVALGGFGESPMIAMDGPEDRGADVASRDAFYDAGDVWATAVYRREVAPKLALRCLDRIDALRESEA